MSQQFYDSVICIIRQKKNILFEGENMDNLIKKEGINRNWKIAIWLGTVIGNYHCGFVEDNLTIIFPRKELMGESKMKVLGIGEVQKESLRVLYHMNSLFSAKQNSVIFTEG